MNLTAHGHEVAVVDNYLRRNICREEDCEPLFIVSNLHARIISGAPRRLSDQGVHRRSLSMGFCRIGVSALRPEAIVHYAEQPSAPYSMLNRRAATLTIKNNLDVTANVIFAVRSSRPRPILSRSAPWANTERPTLTSKRGGSISNTRGAAINSSIHARPGSLYHTTKIMDTDCCGSTCACGACASPT